MNCRTIVHVQILLVSTYELGHQPVGLASPAATLRLGGHTVSTLDLAVEPWHPSALEHVDALAVSVPMHTGMKMALEVARLARSERPELPVALYGLYAAVGAESVLGVLADRLIAGEYEDQLLDWVDSIASPEPKRGVSVDIGVRHFDVPDRSGLPDLDRYARLVWGDEERVVGYVEASRGCRHRCSHCPVPAVYDGRFRITGQAAVLADIQQLVETGARHVTFGDPDFLNAPAYSLGVIEAAHAAFPDLTFDVTVKVEHILLNEALWGRLAAAGVIFVVSAIESLDEEILGYLEKRHTRDDAVRAVEILSDVGIDLHPTWLPFTPWTTAETLVEIVRFLWEQDLAAVTDPVQLSIRLLVPDGSLLVERGYMDGHLAGYDADGLGHLWTPIDPSMDALAQDLAAIAEAGAGGDDLSCLAEMTEAIAAAAGVDLADTLSGPVTSSSDRPRLSEPWFCCAEPTDLQMKVFSRIDG